MKKTLTLVTLLASAFAVNAQKWNVDKAHSNVGFTITHMMLSDVDGQFRDIEATITADKDDLSDAVFEFTAQANSIDTRIERRDTHLKSADFFEVEKYPTVAFKSTSFKHLEGKKYKMKGNLTIKDVTKEVEMDVIVNGPIVNPRNQKKMVGVKATGEIDRYDFHIGGESGAGQSREVVIFANGEFTKE
ncbi:YceI family protein [Jiulongibacter sediminis]|uniref:Polyisoprenoid-binding protein n=1 Tax=Jiulongibacter sediminis TaxID=1605367 RepID=A0A0P7C284_9BACT|nr:YceI family protein [Jiulongibacter sediminis]KPM48130.1 polyisoprenoid-binding protein [Jiulongibacter sediminis]TBX24302.1 polyisoprenoid-binding protein [Jiulongibacter sediminis]